MDISRAKEILELLAEGIDPVTGEILSPEHTCNQGEVVRAFYTILNTLQEASPQKTRQQPENAGKPWTEEDDRLLSNLFDEGNSIKDLCEYFRRSRGSIEVRLMYLNKIEPRPFYFRQKFSKRT